MPAVGKTSWSSNHADRTIQITREGTTPEQKAALIAGSTKLLADVLNKPPHLTFVVIQEVELEDWGVGGLPVPEYRKQTGTDGKH